MNKPYPFLNSHLISFLLNLTHTTGLQAERSRKSNARLENGDPEYPANTNCEAAKAIPPGAKIRPPLKVSWKAFHPRIAWA